MKLPYLFLYAFLCSISLLSWAKVITPEKMDHFYPYAKGQIIVPDVKLDSSFTSEFSSSPILKDLDLSILKIPGIEVGKKIVIVDFKTGEVLKYTFPKVIKISIKPKNREVDIEEQPNWTISIIVDPKLANSENISKEVNRLESHGFGYLGDDLNFSFAKPELLQFKSLSTKDPTYEILKEQLRIKQSLIQEAKIFSHRVLISTRDSNFPKSLLVQLGPKNFLSFEYGDEKLFFGNWLSEHKLMMLSDSRDGFDCNTLLFFSLKEIETVQIRCPNF